MPKHSVDLTKEQAELLQALCDRFGWTKKQALRKGLEALKLLKELEDEKLNLELSDQNGRPRGQVKILLG